MNQLSELLGRVQVGDNGARDAMFAAVYSEAHLLARARLRDGGRNPAVNSVRERLSEKRGGNWRPLTLSAALAANVPDADDTALRVHEPLEVLEKADPRLAQVPQMRYFGGYSEQEIAETLGVTERTVLQDREKARPIPAAALH